ncbi:Os10g0517900 [Oryza sativa Japonica Group]|jgi:SOS-response transcriptional repressor LexA|uniref:Os10g0517900 protein n=2 Tax=Oryza sativa subsp. japonica TaxID=39947 RepID=Q94HY1_ORYSJ|nr:hypothetical protein [Oryza sativa Japonica Group]BAT11674.1 Os10g0517900 [Oryza sativa Japonica Group]
MRSLSSICRRHIEAVEPPSLIKAVAHRGCCRRCASSLPRRRRRASSLPLLSRIEAVTPLPCIEAVAPLPSCIEPALLGGNQFEFAALI